MKKVLVIDDTAEIREVISECLSYMGHEVRTADDGPSGIRMAEQECPDLIICDVNMPGLDGYSVLLALRRIESTATTPFIFLTSISDKIHMRRGMELGADDYLTKPFSQKELKAAVSARLDKQAEVDRQIEKKLDELRGNLTLALPHELRTPLNGILGLSSILIEEYASCSPADLLSSARDINISAQRLHHLIENFLLYSQIQVLLTQKKRLPAAKPPGVSVRDVLPLLANAIARRYSREQDLHLDVGPVLAGAAGDTFKKICEELIDNAFKFSKSGSHVCIRARTHDSGGSEIEIRDQGRGLSDDQISRIGPHIQFDRDRYEQQGAGLGLIIAKRLTELAGGDWQIEGRLGEGCVVRVRFPELTAESTRAAA